MNQTELSEKLGVCPATIVYWEKKGWIESDQGKLKQRHFTPAQLIHATVFNIIREEFGVKVAQVAIKNLEKGWELNEDGLWVFEDGSTLVGNQVLPFSLDSAARVDLIYVRSLAKQWYGRTEWTQHS